MTDSSKVRVGMIGAGEISAYHLAGLAATNLADVRVVMSRTAATAQQAADKFSVPEIATDLDSVIERDDIDAVVIATPDNTHMDYAVRALKAGKAVLLQKPMGRSVEECQMIIDTAKRSGTKLSVSFMHRYFEEVQAIRRLLGQGKMGRVLSARMRNATLGPEWNSWFYSAENVGGGAVMQLGVHGIDLIQYVLGGITDVSANCSLQRPSRTLKDGTIVYPDNEDHAIAHYKLESGVDVVHEISYNECAGTDRFRFEIYCEEGTALLRTQRGRLMLYAPHLTGEEEWTIPELAEPAFGKSHHQHWLNVVQGSEAPEGTAEAGLQTIRVADAIYQSDKKKGWVKLDSSPQYSI
ncbi:MAG: Gfo/Idh/MocA family oxidoreductase [Oceanospirillaceae bacterium]|nr:Gfo/Idh/MocA family oxidoreductase [Oceanospirillaceae bacterium]